MSVFSYRKQPEVNVSKGFNRRHEGCGWGLEGENSPQKLLMCIEVSVQADGTHGCCGKKYPVLDPNPGRRAGEPLKSWHQCYGLRKMLQVAEWLPQQKCYRSQSSGRQWAAGPETTLGHESSQSQEGSPQVAREPQGSAGLRPEASWWMRDQEQQVPGRELRGG